MVLNGSLISEYKNRCLVRLSFMDFRNWSSLIPHSSLIMCSKVRHAWRSLQSILLCMLCSIITIITIIVTINIVTVVIITVTIVVALEVTSPLKSTLLCSCITLCWQGMSGHPDPPRLPSSRFQALEHLWQCQMIPGKLPAGTIYYIS